MKTISSGILLSFLVFNIAFAQKETFDILTFETPPGYQRQEGKGALQFTRTLPTGGYCKIVVFASRPASDDAQKEFLEEWHECVKANEPSAGAADETNVAGPENGWMIISGKVAIDKPAGKSLILLISIIGHSRATSVKMDMNDAGFAPDVEAFISKIEPDIKKAESLSAGSAMQKANTSLPVPSVNVTSHLSSAKNPIIGLWWSIGSSTLTTTNYATIGSTQVTTYSTQSYLSSKKITFFDDGTFCQVFPSSGVVDYPAQRAKNPDYWGTYTLDAQGNGTIKLDGMQTVWPFTFKNNKLIYDKWEYNKKSTVDHAKIKGLYTAEKDPSAYTGAEPTIEFLENGRFADHGAIYWIRHVKGYTEDMQDKMTGAGTYEVHDFTMTFTYDDGRLIRLAIMDNAPSPQQLPLGLILLDRK